MYEDHRRGFCVAERYPVDFVVVRVVGVFEDFCEFDEEGGTHFDVILQTMDSGSLIELTGYFLRLGLIT